MKTRLLLPLLVLALAVPAFAQRSIDTQNHSWGGYHWARTSNPFALKVYDNVDSRWDSALRTAESDWSKSTVLDMVGVNQAISSTKRCTSASGVVEVCNNTYGNNGWLGIAGISVSGGHITKGYVKLNDTYFNTPQYNTSAWRALVTCQEVGHTIGLDHQDENFNNANLGTCMDYTNDPSSNQHPNTHDYDELKIIYQHLDSTTTVANIWDIAAQSVGSFRGGELVAAGQWGTAIGFDAEGRANLFAMTVGHDENGDDVVEYTHVVWAPFGIETPDPETRIRE